MHHQHDRPSRAVLPPPHVCTAFHVSGIPKPLPGGQGTSSRVGHVVFKPGASEAETAWLAALLHDLHSAVFRIARPLQAVTGAWVYAGWSACEYVAGEEVPGRWGEKIAVCRAFHQAVARAPRPAFLDHATHLFARADRAAWHEAPITSHARLAPAVATLNALWRPIHLPNQLIHGDIGGNFLFAEGLPPAVIDVSPYWRPAAYAVAILIADAVVWGGADTTIWADVADVAELPQLLVRAELSRLLQLDGLWTDAGVNKLDEVEAHWPLIETLVSLIS